MEESEQEYRPDTDSDESVGSAKLLQTQNQSHGDVPMFSVGASEEESDHNTEQEEPLVYDEELSLNKRAAPVHHELAERPFKRRRGPVNVEYLELLNESIDEAAQRVCLDDDISLQSAQIGATSWSSLEKRLFYEALARVGRLDLKGIASRIGTKSVIEVQHYLQFMDNAVELRHTVNRRSFLEPAEYPAAVELSQPCCHAQEEAADAISVQQEVHEQQREQQRWKDIWDITPSVIETMKQDDTNAGPSGSDPAFADLFHLSNWLELSERIFMNSSIPPSNWTFIDDRPPSIWATAIDDFYSLAVSFTKRVIHTTLLISMSRIRNQTDLRDTVEVVKAKDVAAAVSSLGLDLNPRARWKGCARRLRLNVFDGLSDDEEEDSDSIPEGEPLTFDDVENMLSEEQEEPGYMNDTASSGFVRPIELDTDDDMSLTSDVDNMAETKEEFTVDKEADEVLVYAAPAVRDMQNAKKALKARIETERQQETQADEHDNVASQQAEADMWEVLNQAPPPGVVKNKHITSLPKRSNWNVENIYPMGRKWTEQLQYYAEWESGHGNMDAPDEDEASIALV